MPNQSAKKRQNMSQENRSDFVFNSVMDKTEHLEHRLDLWLFAWSRRRRAAREKTWPGLREASDRRLQSFSEQLAEALAEASAAR